MRLTEILRPDMVWPSLDARTKPDAIAELARRAAEADPRLNAQRIAAVLLEREQLGSTGIQDGIAIPHGKVPELPGIMIACGRSVPGVEFDAHDRRPTHLFFMLLAPDSAAGQHLKTLARLSRLLKEARVRERIMAATDAADMYRIINEEDERI